MPRESGHQPVTPTDNLSRSPDAKESGVPDSVSQSRIQMRGLVLRGGQPVAHSSSTPSVERLANLCKVTARMQNGWGSWVSTWVGRNHSFFYDTQRLSEESVLLLICFSEKKYQSTTLKMQHISMVAQMAINNICTLWLGLNREEIFHGYYVIYIIERTVVCFIFQI